jgi:hypothetical protein
VLEQVGAVERDGRDNGQGEPENRQHARSVAGDHEATMKPKVAPMRRFDPRAVGRFECRAWETYYRRRWAAFLIASVAMVRAAFGMSWPRTLKGAWLVLRANQKWAPFPDIDPDAVRQAAALRAEAMDVSDRWVKVGCDPSDPQLALERSLLVRSYAALLAAVHR